MKSTHLRDQGKRVWWITALCRRPHEAPHTAHFLSPVLQMIVTVMKAVMKASLHRVPTMRQAQFYIFYGMHLLNAHAQPCKVHASIYL